MNWKSVGKTKIKIVFTSDAYSPMETVEKILDFLGMKKGEWCFDQMMRNDPLITIDEVSVLDYKRRRINPLLQRKRRNEK